MVASRSARGACAAGKRRTRSAWPTTTAVGSRRTRKRSEPRRGATGSGSATTPSIESEGEPTPADAIGSGEPRTQSIGSADEPTTAAIGSDNEPDSRRHRPRQTTAEFCAARAGKRARLRPAKPSACLADRERQARGITWAYAASGSSATLSGSDFREALRTFAGGGAAGADPPARPARQGQHGRRAAPAGTSRHLRRLRNLRWSS
jgi:hypothetical protein